eukprot:298886_1
MQIIINLMNFSKLMSLKICQILQPFIFHLKKMILLIGGHQEDEEANGIWIYSLSSQKWSKFETSWGEYEWLPVIFTHGILTADEHYVIITGESDPYYGYDPDDEWMPNPYIIWILDVRQQTFTVRTSQIKSPKHTRHHLVRSGGGIYDEILVVGYIKTLFGLLEFAHLQLPPIHITILVSKFYVMETLHWIDDEDHFAISIKDILSS